MEENVVEIYNLCKTYKNTNAVSHLHMEIKKGEIYGFIGKNGAGKSTTLKMIVGLIFPTSGEIKLFGEKRNAFTSKRIGSLIENAGLYPNLSAYDNMELKAVAMGTYNKDKIIELLNLVGLDFKNKKTVKKFSLGMKQRLGIALALLGNPDLLILDEPINGLDPEGIREIREIILYLNETKKMTIIISSHILGELSKIATKYGIIRNGQMIEEITSKELDKCCRNYISLKVAKADKAIPLLERNLKIKDYTVHENNEIWIFDNVKSSDIAMLLTKHNILIHQIYYQKQDLESYFLEKCGGKQ
ncbi:ATP-binding cassette domain-containing protein [Thomasclavelia saccharogumia]|uniref:ATP-binding cassette domain-containing protein n=1 Tax=Thomasclavelia saccharogumia TaxID=341225 RepID=UPI00047C21EC|nr:ATP-binding cassette domain-containing protein [Thomasclavelia saccharogumia]